MDSRSYTDAEFAKLVDLRRKWLGSYSDENKRFELACEIDAIEYRDYTEEQRRSIRNRKHQEANYIKIRIACPHLAINRDNFITEANIAQNMPPKILFGVTELGNVAATLCKEFRKQKIEAYNIDFFEHPFRFSSDLSRVRLERHQEKLAMLSFVSEVIAEFDIFNVIDNSTLLDSFDLSVYRELDKKIVMHYSGGEARLYNLAARKNSHLTLVEDTYFTKGLAGDITNLTNYIFYSNYAHAAVAYYNEFAGQIKLAFTEYYEIPQPIVLSDFEIYRNVSKKNVKFTIVHAPSNTHIKGSHYVADAINALKMQYDFEFIPLVGVSHDEAKATYAKADLVVDQLLLGWYGMLSLEAMAMGKPVICYLCEEFFEQTYVKDVPIINADVNNIKDKIEWALNNRDKLEELGKKGIEYVRKNHDSEKIIKRYLECYEKIPFQKPSPIKSPNRQNTQSMDEIKTGLQYMSSKQIDIQEFFKINGYKKVGLYGSNEMSSQVTALMKPNAGIGLEVGEFMPDNGQQGFDAIILMMETEINSFYIAARESCPTALVVTLNELILLAV